METFTNRGSMVHALLVVAFIVFSLNTPISTPSWALEPPDPGEIAGIRQTPDANERFDFVRRLGNHKVDTFLLKKAVHKTMRMYLKSEGKTTTEIALRAPVLAPPPGWQGMPTTGNVNILALLIEFQDHIHTNSRNDIHDNLFGAGDPSRSPFESLTTYYDRASYNQLDLSNGNTLGWYQTAYNRSAVTQNRRGRENLIKEVIDHFNNQGHDFSQYDNDGDGDIDYFIVIWTGQDNGWGNFWWGYQTWFSDSTYRVDGVTLGKYSWQWEARPVGDTFNPIVVIHETGHALGVPDFYDYDDSRGPDGGVGGLDIMDGNKGDHNCFSKWMLEWVTPTFIASGTQTVTLNASGTSQDCVIIWPGVTSGDLFSEFFVVQNRHRLGNDNDRTMPGDGMLIWHVDAQLDASGTDFLYDNSYTAHKLLRLMEADGLEEIETGNGIADSGDYFKAGDAFGQSTTPSSKMYDGTESNVEVFNINIAGPGTQMSSTFRIASSIAADYTVTNMSLDKSSAQSGDQVQVTYTARNQGGAPVACINMAIFLSSDSVISASDTQLKSWGLPNCDLAPGQTITQTWTVDIPVGTADGSYFIGVYADVNNDQTESSETNNTDSKPIRIGDNGDRAWLRAYRMLSLNALDIALLRKYRDTCLKNTNDGKLYTKLLYENSSAALKVLLDNPELIARAHNLFQANKQEISEALKSHETFIVNSAEIISFLEAYAEKSPQPLKAFLQMVKHELLKKGQKGKTFLGFRFSSFSEKLASAE